LRLHGAGRTEGTDPGRPAARQLRRAVCVVWPARPCALLRQKHQASKAAAARCVQRLKAFWDHACVSLRVLLLNSNAARRTPHARAHDVHAPVLLLASLDARSPPACVPPCAPPRVDPYAFSSFSLLGLPRTANPTPPCFASLRTNRLAFSRGRRAQGAPVDATAPCASAHPRPQGAV